MFCSLLCLTPSGEVKVATFLRLGRLWMWTGCDTNRAIKFQKIYKKRFSISMFTPPRRILMRVLNVVLLFVAVGAFATGANAACTFVATGTEIVLTASCTTDTTILIPNGFTMDLNQNTITGVDPAGGHFVGAVVKNGGTEAEITNGTITVAGLSDVCDAGDNRLRGVMFKGASGSISNLRVLNINQGPSGCQEGNAIEVRNDGDSATTTRVTVDSNTVTGYQKTGIVCNFDVNVTVTNNTVSGGGPVSYIARNGIQLGWGATGMIKRNTVSGNSYTGQDVSGGIIVVGGPYYGEAYCVGVQVMQNTITNNDIGAFLSQADIGFAAPATATNIKVVNNTISNSAVTNGYVYQAGVSDVGNNDKIVSNTISGAGYNTATLPGSTFYVDADVSFTNRPHVHANK
jgi:hypothetical protein